MSYSTLHYIYPRTGSNVSVRFRKAILKRGKRAGKLCYQGDGYVPESLREILSPYLSYWGSTLPEDLPRVVAILRLNGIDVHVDK